MVIVLLILLIVNVNCCALDQEFIKKTAKKFTDQRSMVEDPIPVESKTSNIDAALPYLQVSRVLICDLLEKNPIEEKDHLKEYQYNVDKNNIEPPSSTIKAKIQILPNNKIAFFWSFKETKTAYLYYNDHIHKNQVTSWDVPSVSDLAVSLYNKFVCGVDNFWKVKVFTVSTDNFVSKQANPIFGMQIYDYPDLDEKIKEERKGGLYSIPSTQATSIICAEKNWYCSINKSIYEFQINGNTKKVHNIQKVVNFEEGSFKKESNEFWIEKLAIYEDILIANTLEKGKNQAYFFNCKKKDNNGFLEILPVSEEDQFTVRLFNQQYVILVDNKSDVNNIEPITACEIARLRNLNDLEKYLAVDINEIENRVALLSTNSRFNYAFAPKVKVADFIPTNLKPIIEEFNKQVKILSSDKNNAQKLVQKILNVFYPQSRWQRFYQTAKNNIKWIGLAAVGALGLTTWLYSKNRGSGHNSAAWSKVLTPNTTSTGIK